MPKLAFPVLPAGLLVDVVIGLDKDTIAAQIAAGQPVTAPLLVRGEIDTGTNVTAVSASILRGLGVPVKYATPTHTAAGQVTANVFKVSVGIRNVADPAGDELVEAALSVME